MTNHTPQGRRPPFAAYGPASAGYGPTAPVATAPAPAPTAPWPSPQPAPAAGFVPSPGPAGPRPPRRALGITALILACVGTLFAFSSSPLVWLLLVSALVLAIVQLARRGSARVPAVIAIVIVVLGFVIALGAAILSGLTSSASSGGYDPETDAYTLAERLSVAPGDGSQVDLTWGTAETIVDSGTGDDVWSIRALAPVDVTAETSTASPSPFSASGSLVAIPIEMTNLTDESIDPDGWQLRFSSSFVSPDGSFADGVYDPAIMDAYPSRYDIAEPLAPGETVTFYLVEDMPLADAEKGSVEVGLYSGDLITWRASGG
jgi:hypothetical protein